MAIYPTTPGFRASDSTSIPGHQNGPRSSSIPSHLTYWLRGSLGECYLHPSSSSNGSASSSLTVITPDVLVFDKDYNLKYALAGAPGKGLLYNWKYHQFTAIDPFLARVQVAVSLDPTDICYGFYPYQEPGIVYTDLDVNPFTNQNVRNRIVQFYYKPHSLDP